MQFLYAYHIILIYIAPLSHYIAKWLHACHAVMENGYQICIGDFTGAWEGGQWPPVENYVLKNLRERLEYNLAQLVLAFKIILASILGHFKP